MAEKLTQFGFKKVLTTGNTLWSIEPRILHGRLVALKFLSEHLAKRAQALERKFI